MEKQIYLKKIGCSNCGAELFFDPGTQMTNCNFCGSKFQIENTKDEEIIMPDGILPFKITKKQYEDAVLGWLSEGDYTPDDILNSTVFESVNGVYLPMWFFKGRYHGNWSASSGYNRTEYYNEYSESQKKMVRKSRTVTDWRPSSGQCSGEFTILAFAGVGKGIKSDIAVYAHGTSFSRGDLKPFDSQYTMGFNIIDFTTDDHSTWDSLGKIQADSQVETDAKRRIPGDKYKDFYCDVLYDKEKPLRVYVPFWITNYKYDEREFHVYMDGTTSSRIQGVRPEDQARKDEVKKKFYKGHISAVLVVLFFIIAANSSHDSKDVFNSLASWAIALTAVMYGIGYYQKSKIIKESKEKRQKILNNVLNGISNEETLGFDEKKIESNDSNAVFKMKYILIIALSLISIITIFLVKTNKTNDVNSSNNNSEIEISNNFNKEDDIYKSDSTQKESSEVALDVQLFDLYQNIEYTSDGSGSVEILEFEKDERNDLNIIYSSNNNKKIKLGFNGNSIFFKQNINKLYVIDNIRDQNAKFDLINPDGSVQVFEANVKNKVNSILNNYYLDANSNNFNANNYFDQNVDAYIGVKNTTPNEINKFFANNDFNEANSIFKENTLIFEENKGNLNFWSYWIEFSCYRPSKNKYQECKIKIIVGLNKQLKICSYKEVKVENLNFHL